MNKSESIKELATALNKFQSEIESVKKTSEGYGYNYSDLSSVIQYAKPFLSKNGLSVSQMLGSDSSGNTTVYTIVMHSSGEYIESMVSVPMLQAKGMNSCQAAGASISYFRRYAYQAALCMSSDDNDAGSLQDDKQLPTQKPEQPRVAIITKAQEDELTNICKAKKMNRKQVGDIWAHFQVSKFSEVPAAYFDNVKKAVEGVK